MKKIFESLLVVLTLSFFVDAHAEQVDSYFAWEIKNYDAYSRSNLAVYGMDIDKVEVAKSNDANNKLFVYDMNMGDIDSVRDKLYGMINRGEYSDAARLCEMIAVYQKIIFGTDFLDESLTELSVKLYLITDELDAAERKINFLTDNALDDLIKIRVLNLKSDLLNRRGKYNAALQVTEEVAELLKTAPDEKLSLINQSRAARAYCGLGDIKRSEEHAEKIFLRMQEVFGEADLETLALMSTEAKNCLATQRDIDGLKILLNKYQVISQKYGTDNLIVPSKARLELASYFFELNNTVDGRELLSKLKDTVDGREILDSLSLFATRYVLDQNYHEAFRLYKALNETATKYLPDDDPIVLASEFGLADMNYRLGNIGASVELVKKNLPRFKRIFGEKDDKTLDLMKILSENYLLLGKYSDAKKIVDERLRICQKNFSEHDAQTLAATIDMANIYYRTGKYTSADKLLGDLNISQNMETFKSNPKILHAWWFNKYFGERMKGGNVAIGEYANFFKNAGKLYEKGFLNLSESIDMDMESLKLTSILGGAGDDAYIHLGQINIAKLILSEHHPKILGMMNAVSELHIKYGELDDAERYAEQILKLSRAHFGGGNFYEWMALKTLAKIRRAEKKFTTALELDNRALQIAEAVCGRNSLERMESLDAIADDYAAGGDLAGAIKIRERTLSEYKEILEDSDAATLRVMTNLAGDYVAAKRYADAVKLCDETLALEKVPVYIGDEISFYNSIGALVRIKATAQKLLGDDAAAYVNYKKLIQFYETQRLVSVQSSSSPAGKTKWFAGNIPVYKDAAVVAASGKVNDSTFAFYCAEFCKGRNLIDRYEDVLVVKDYLLDAREKNILAEYGNLLSACGAVSEYAEEVNDDTLRFNAEIIRLNLYFSNEYTKNELREKYSDEMTPKGGSGTYIWSWDNLLRNFDVKKNQAAIPNGACFVEFLKISDESLLVIFLRNDGDVQAVNVFVGKEFFDDCLLYHELNAYTDIGDLNSGGKYLWNDNGKYVISAERHYESNSEAFSLKNEPADNEKFNALRLEISAGLSAKLMPILEKFAGDSSHWIISPDSELNLVPFETVIYRGKLLIESVDVSYVPSLAVMNLMKEREQRNFYLSRSKELFAMGNAIYDSSTPTKPHGGEQEYLWRDFTWSAKEIDNVSSLFDSKSIFKREEATEKKLWELNKSGELSEYKYLFFSAHGIFDSKRSERSAIVLSQKFTDEDYDGYVTVGEWMGYDLQSNLVYLSACESGLGGDQAGEGVVGIPYALTVAGNKDTVMSLWKVREEPTMEFTSAFFEKLSRGKSEVVALNETKREFLRQKNTINNHPSVWAAFLLYGI